MITRKRRKEEVKERWREFPYQMMERKNEGRERGKRRENGGATETSAL